MKMFGAYLWNIWLSVDMLGNVLFGGRAGETISLRAARAALKGKPIGCVLCKLLDKFDPHHCWKSLQHAEARARH